MSDDRYYTVRVDKRGRPDPDTGPDGPLTREEALARQTGPDPHSAWRTITLRAVEVGDGVVTEYGQELKGGGYQTWNTEPYIEKIYPLAEKIKNERRHGKVYRRRIIVVEDWTEVDAP